VATEELCLSAKKILKKSGRGERFMTFNKLSTEDKIMVVTLKMERIAKKIEARKKVVTDPDEIKKLEEEERALNEIRKDLVHVREGLGKILGSLS